MTCAEPGCDQPRVLVPVRDSSRCYFHDKKAAGLFDTEPKTSRVWSLLSDEEAALLRAVQGWEAA